MGVEAFISEPSIEALDEAILDRSAWSNEFELYPLAIGPAIDRFGAKLRAVIHRDRLRIAPSLVNPQQMLPRAEVAVKSQAFRNLEARNDTALDSLLPSLRA